MIRNCITFDFKYIPSHIEKVIYLSLDCRVYHFFPQVWDFLFIYLFYFILFFLFIFIFYFLCFYLSFYVFISTQEQEQLISVITKIFELEKYTIVRKGFYAVAFVTDNPKLAALSEPNSQGVVVWWF